MKRSDLREVRALEDRLASLEHLESIRSSRGGDDIKVVKVSVGMHLDDDRYVGGGVFHIHPARFMALLRSEITFVKEQFIKLGVTL